MKIKNLLVVPLLVGFAQFTHAACIQAVSTPSFCANSSGAVLAACTIHYKIGVSVQNGAKLSNGKILFAGGVEGGKPTARSFIVDPASGLICDSGVMKQARQGMFDAVEFSGGKVLIVGGLGSRGRATNASEIYDIASGSWSATGSFSQASVNVRLAVMPNGNILAVAGRLGQDKNYQPIVFSQVYNVATKQFAAPVSLDRHRERYVLGIHSGKMYLVGGQILGSNGASDCLANKEILAYDQDSNKWGTLGDKLSEPRVAFSPSEIRSYASNNLADPKIESVSSSQIILKGSYRCDGGAGSREDLTINLL